jgi:hypothetical protein
MSDAPAFLDAIFCGDPVPPARVRTTAKYRLIQTVNKTALACVVLCVSGFLGGCASVTEETSHAADLEKAMAANHVATLGVLNRMNAEMLPYDIERASRPSQTSFGKKDLTFLAPSDIAAWDKILGGLDNYCAALSELTSGKEATDTAGACEALGKNMKSLAAAAKVTPNSAEGAAAVGLAALGDLLVRERANADARAVAAKADPKFQEIVGDLVSALGFSGRPPVETSHGLAATYEVSFESAHLKSRLKDFPGDTISGFDAMGADERRAKIKEFVAWLGTEQEHDDFLGALKALAAALDKAAVAHAALAGGSKENVSAAFADLQAEMKNIKAISDSFKS